LTRAEQPYEKIDTGRKRYWYKGEPEAAHALRELGVVVAGLANNHVLDYGHDGLADTVAALEAAGIAHCGAGGDEPGARAPAIVEVAGLRIGVLSCMQRYDIYVRERSYASGPRGGCFRLRLRTLREELAALEGVVDIRIVLAHWGRNYRPVTRVQERLAAGLVEAGADIVVGHHPHIPQRVQLIDGRPVFFSLGNGILGTPGRFHSGRPPYGLLPILELDREGVQGIELHLLEVDNAEVAFSPRPAVGAAAVEYLRTLVAPEAGWRAHGAAMRLAAHAVAA
jgi:poly-gamma-glutamate synthesis protein (capsule biosynthesis protein)